MRELENQIKIKSFFLDLTEEDIAERANIEVERLHEIYSGKEPTIKEIISLSKAIELNLIRLVALSDMKYSSLIVVTPKKLESLVEKKKADDLALIFLNHQIVTINGKAYTVGPHGKLTNEINEELLRSIYDLFMKTGHVGIVSDFFDGAPVSIRSLEELDKYGSYAKEFFLYGIFKKKDDPEGNFKCPFPRYYGYILNSVGEEDQKVMLDALKKRMDLYKQYIIEQIKEGFKFVRFENSLLLKKDKSYISVHLPEIRMKKPNETMDEINSEIQSIYKLIQEDATFEDIYF